MLTLSEKLFFDNSETRNQ